MIVTKFTSAVISTQPFFYFRLSSVVALVSRLLLSPGTVCCPDLKVGQLTIQVSESDGFADFLLFVVAAIYVQANIVVVKPIVVGSIAIQRYQLEF